MIHVISKLRSPQYLLPFTQSKLSSAAAETSSPVTAFVQTLLKLLESGTAKPHLKHLTELFSFLLDFGKLGNIQSLKIYQIYQSHLEEYCSLRGEIPFSKACRLITLALIAPTCPGFQFYK